MQIMKLEEYKHLLGYSEFKNKKLRELEEKIKEIDKLNQMKSKCLKYRLSKKYCQQYKK